MSEALNKPATYEDLLAVPSRLVAEIINGRLETHPRLAPGHALAASSLGGELVNLFQKGDEGPGGWWIFDEPELHLNQQVLVPDLAGWRRDRMPRLPDTAWFEIVPDWTCEILSPSTVRVDRTEKMPIYAQHGVMHLWLIDPELRTLEAYSLRDGQWGLGAVLNDDRAVSVPPFEAIEFSLASLWET